MAQSEDKERSLREEMTWRLGSILGFCSVALWLGVFALISVPMFHDCRYIAAQHYVWCKDLKDHRECRVAGDVPARQVWVCGYRTPPGSDLGAPVYTPSEIMWLGARNATILVVLICALAAAGWGAVIAVRRRLAKP